ncbi:MAG TPA: hypothetical protein VK176_08730 [Phycisphaerales bacterium]|nr:hypothetical protein [Phycisphaerales bacterium]
MMILSASSCSDVAALAQAVGPPRSPLVPTWLAITAATITLLALMVHMRLVMTSEMPSSRRRIRTVNGWLMLGAIPLLAFAFGIATPSQARTFGLAWAASVGLIGIIVMLAMLDMLNNWRLHRRASRALREDLSTLRAQHRAGRGPTEVHGSQS